MRERWYGQVRETLIAIEYYYYYEYLIEDRNTVVVMLPKLYKEMFISIRLSTKPTRHQQNYHTDQVHPIGHKMALG